MTILTALPARVVLTAMDWNEADHPRDAIGRFGNGGAGATVKAFKEQPIMWTSKASGLEYVANPLAQVPASEKSAAREQGDTLEDAFADGDQAHFSVKTVDPAALKSLQTQVAREQVVSVHAAGSHNAESNGELPLVIDGPNGLILIDGNHRSSAALLAGEHIKAQVFDYAGYKAAKAAAKPAVKNSGPSDDDLLAELNA